MIAEDQQHSDTQQALVFNSFSRYVSAEMFYNRRSWKTRKLPNADNKAGIQRIHNWASDIVLWEYGLANAIYIYFRNPDDAVIWDLLQ